MQTKNKFSDKIHLIISTLIVVPVAFVYGFQPDLMFDIHLKTIDELNIFKAIMGLYLGFSTLWILGIFKQDYLRIAIITNTIFMLGLGFGRVASIILNGIPTYNYIYGMIAELLLGAYGVWVWKQKQITKEW